MVGIRKALCLLAATLGALAALAGLSAPAEASTVQYFGYFAARLAPEGSTVPGAGNHLPEVAYRSNLNWVQISDFARYAPEVLDDCAPKSCIVATGHEFFQGCDVPQSPNCALYPNYAERWGKLANAVRSRLDKVAAFYLRDEPQWYGASVADVRTAAQTIKQTFPGVPVMMVEGGPQVTPSLQIPAEIDWVGFDWYCQPFSTVAKTLATLETRTTPTQQLFLVPEAAPLSDCHGAKGHATDAEIAALQWQYFKLAEAHPRVVGLLNFGFWTSGKASAQLPLTVAAHEQIFNLIRPPAPSPAALQVEIKTRKGRLKANGATRVRLACPAGSGASCDGRLTMRRSGKRLASSEFAVAPGATAAVRLRVAKRLRAPVIRQAKRADGVRVKLAARTALGKVAGRARLSARR